MASEARVGGLGRAGSIEAGRGAVELAVILAGAAAVLLVPRLFGDPQGVDPFAWRLSAYFAAVWGASLAIPTLRHLTGLTFSLLTLALPVSTWLWLLAYSGPAPGLIGPPDSVARNVAAGVGQLVLALAMASVFWVLAGRPRLRLLARPGRAALVLTVGGTLAFLVVAFALPATLLGREGVPLLALSGSAGAGLGVANATSAVAQEVQFRAVFLVALEQRFSPALAVVIQGLVFGVGHLAIQYEGPAASFIPIVVGLGWLWGWMTIRAKSLLPAAVIHVVADFFILAAVVSGLYGGG